MHPEIKTEHKAMVAARYWGQTGVTVHSNDEQYPMRVESAMSAGLPVFEVFRLLLRPINTITQEHLEDIAILVGATPHLADHVMGMLKEMLLDDNKDLSEVICEQGLFLNPYTMYCLVQQLYAWGYDMPIWFGIGHPCNGLTAIEAGIAIDITKHPITHP